MSSTASSHPDTAKQAAILQQAIDVFAEQGFRNADVQVIADRAGVGKGTVYRYFGNKQDLFWAAALEVTQRMADHIWAATEPVDSPLEKIRAAAVAYYEFFDANPACLEICVLDRAEFRGSVPEPHQEYHDALIERFAAIFREGIQRGEIRPVDVNAAIVGLGGLLYGIAFQGCYDLAHRTTAEVGRVAIDTFLQGIRTNPAEPPTDRKEQKEQAE
ncbi:MAG: TetR/AcrR family transcriptional regulator [Pirellulales bacterium]|nr:TetR/AcrR family transcriptional regulator [Pirellulales bacterium]